MTKPTVWDFYIKVASCEKQANDALKVEQSAREVHEKACMALNEAQRELREHLQGIHAEAARCLSFRFNNLGQIEEITP